MERYDGKIEAFRDESTRLRNAGLALAAVVSLGWMGGVALGVAAAVEGSRSEFARDLPAWLTPALQLVVVAAVTAVILVLLAIVRRIRIRSHALSEALPRLLR